MIIKYKNYYFFLLNMGALGCCTRNCQNNQEGKNQMIFSNEELFQTDARTNDEKDKMVTYSSNMNKKDFQNIKLKFENSLKGLGEFIDETTFDEILKTNEFICDIEFPKKIENYKEENIFESKPIKFSNGEIYKGSWNKYNKRHGFGINISPDGNIYKGLWNNDKIGNYGLLLDSIGNYYIGELKDGKMEGKGELLLKYKIKYKGEFSNDIPNGKGIFEDYEKGSKYNGEIFNGKKNGRGILEYNDGTIYEGNFKDDKYDGNGILKYNDGRKYEGEFKDGKIKGKGKFMWGDGKIYEGEYDDFMKKGFGKFYWNDDKYYEGEWLNNRQHGKGLLHCDGKEVNGIFRFGKIIKGD